MRRTLTLILMFSLVLTACETVKGVGKDMQKGGRWIEEKAEKAD